MTILLFRFEPYKDLCFVLKVSVSLYVFSPWENETVLLQAVFFKTNALSLKEKMLLDEIFTAYKKFQIKGK